MYTSKDALKDILRTVYKIQTVRYALASEVLKKLKQKASEPSVVEVNGYQTYIWLPPDKKKEYRVWPPTLTGYPEGWLAEKQYVPYDRIIPVDWDGLFNKLKPRFSVKLAVLDSIRNMLNMLTAAEIVMDYANPSEWSGRAIFNDMPAWYRIDSNGLTVTYYDETVGRWVTETLAYPGDNQACRVKWWVNELLKVISQGVYVQCPDGTSKVVGYEAPLCSDLDQTVTFLRSLSEKHGFCVVYRPKALYFVDGPLEGITWTEQYTPPLLFYSPASGPTQLDVNQFYERLENAINTCAEKLKGVYCG